MSFLENCFTNTQLMYGSPFFVPILMLVDFHKNWHTNISISLKNNKIYLQSRYIVV